MAGETQTLNFGPEWLRALSSGGTVTSPPLSPALPKYKLADYRYGREEMLALYLKDLKIPSDLMDKEFLPILQEEPLLPLALVPFTEEEQRNLSMSVNSTAVLRLMGRGGGTVVGAPRGRSTSRGRGRGRGEGGFYQRSFDEVECSFGRGTREMHRSQSWEERGDRRFEKPGRKEPDYLPNSFTTSVVPGNVKAAPEQKIIRPTFEEGGMTIVGKKPDFTRSESDNWRHLKEELNGGEDEEGGIWRAAGVRKDGERWPRPHSPESLRAPGWREPLDRRRRFDCDFQEREDERGYHRIKPGNGSLEEDKDSLPEWCLEDAEEETGTFDSSGAFLPSKMVQKEPIPEEQELEFRHSDGREEHLDSEGNHNEEAKESEKTAKKERMERSTAEPATNLKDGRPSSPSHWSGNPVDSRMQEQVSCSLLSKKEESPPEQIKEPGEQKKNSTQKLAISKGPMNVEEMVPAAVQPVAHSSLKAAAAKKSLSTPLSSQNTAARMPQNHMTGAPGMGSISTEFEDDDGLKDLEQQAEKMVAYLQDSALDDERLAAKITDHQTKESSLPLPQETLQKWFYKDPQGAIQGPFSNPEMAEWCQAGYFTMSLLVRRACDDSFQPLGDLMKLWGRIPFTSGPAPPQLLGELDLERRNRQQEITTLYHLHHLQYQQFILQQRYAQLFAEQQKTSLSSQQQQQLAVLLQQFQSLKMRISEQNLVHPVTRAIPVPDTNSAWELQTSASQPPAWEGNSVWDLPVDAVAPGPSPEHLQIEKAKAAKLEQERREEEIRAKKQEEEQKRLEELRRQQEELRRQQEELRRQQEELLRRQQEEEERKCREEAELARRKQEEALRRQREQEIALRQQREEEERQQQEKVLRQLEERRKKEKEEQQRQEELLQKQEEVARWAREEEEAAQRLAEENRLKMEEETAKLQQEEEDRKKKEAELQRQKELQRQRQQQQEALRRLQQQQQQLQMAQMKLPSSSTWGQQASTAGISTLQSSLSLAEIQKLEEERERQLQEEQSRQQRELMMTFQQQQQHQQEQKLAGWGYISKGTGNAKSLVEIQKEEAKQMQKHKQENKARNSSSVTAASVVATDSTSTTITVASIQNSGGSSVWGAMNTSPTNQWASDSVSSIWSNTDCKNSNLGFWDDAAKDVGPRNTANKNKSKNNSSLGRSSGGSSRQNKKVEEEEKLKQLFHGVNKVHDGFTQWCEQMLNALNTANNLDVPTFVCFLKEVESAYEVQDYIRAYLGDTPEAKEFGKQFVERRAKQKMNQQWQQPPPPQLKQDSVWGLNYPAVQTVFQTNQSNNQQSSFESVQSAGKKKKKQRMVRADPSLLGFSVNASSERLNMGEIETLEEF